MSYRTHRFSWLHTAQTLGVSALSYTDSAGTDDVSAGVDLDRLIDSQAKPQHYGNAAVIRRVLLDLAGALQKPTRIIIPAPHNFEAEGYAWCARESTDDVTYTDLDEDHSGALVYISPCAGVPLDYCWDTAGSNGYRYIELLSQKGWASTAASFGEFFATRVWQPTTGHVHDWRPLPPASNQVLSRMDGGDTFSVVRGPGLREFEVTHTQVQAADLKGYDELYASVEQHTAFWYEHSGSGGWGEVLLPLDTLSGTTDLNLVSSLQTAPDGTASAATGLVTSNTSDARFEIPLAEAVDLRGMFLSLDVKYGTSIAISAADDCMLELRDANGGYTRYGIVKTRISPPAASAEWHRIYIDPGASDTFGSSSTLGSVDISAVTEIRFLMELGVSARTMTVDDIRMWPKEAMPRRVRFAGVPDKTQDNQIPTSSRGPTYTLRMRMIEETA